MTGEDIAEDMHCNNTVEAANSVEKDVKSTFIYFLSTLYFMLQNSRSASKRI